MKIQIIQLHRNDDSISVRDKIGWSQAQCILLAWPMVGHVLHQRLELNLVRRHAERLGARLALITSDPVVCSHARLLHIPVLDHPGQINDTHWECGELANDAFRRRRIPKDLERMRREAHQRSPAWLEHPAVRIMVFMISVLALCALAIFLLF